MSRADTTVPRLDHIIVVVMENHSYDQARTLPYTASLIKKGVLMTSSYAVTHPSLPNYLALWSGSTQGVTNDACPPAGAPYSVENFGHAVEAAGRTWKAYSENLPSVGSTACSSGSYARKHCPWSYFANLNHQNERPYTDFAKDIAAHTLPDLAFIIPNNCDNTHDCSTSTGDSWLASNLPAMLAALGPGGLLVLTWDEDDRSSSNHILTVIVGPTVKSGYSCSTKVNHYTLVRLLCDKLGIRPFGSATSEKSITDIWQGATATNVSSWGKLHILYR